MQTTIQFIRSLALGVAALTVCACTNVVEREPVTQTSTTETTTVHTPTSTETTETTTVRTPVRTEVERD